MREAIFEMKLDHNRNKSFMPIYFSHLPTLPTNLTPVSAAGAIHDILEHIDGDYSINGEWRAIGARLFIDNDPYDAMALLTGDTEFFIRELNRTKSPIAINPYESKPMPITLMWLYDKVEKEKHKYFNGPWARHISTEHYLQNISQNIVYGYMQASHHYKSAPAINLVRQELRRYTSTYEDYSKLGDKLTILYEDGAWVGSWFPPRRGWLGFDPASGT